MRSNTEQLKIAEKYLGESCPKCCSMKNNCCCYFVSKIFKEAGNASLFYSGVTVTYCPNAIKWCKTQLAQIPLFLAMPSDIIFFDWELNGTPNHIGFVDHRMDDTQIATLEGNTTSKYVVARRVRDAKYIQGVFRPHFKASYDTSKPLVIDGKFEYNSVAMLQKALGIKVDGILGRGTIKSLQKLVGTSQDGSWGSGTSKAVQTFLKKEGFYKGAIDGHVYEGTVKALQTWINSKVGKTTIVVDKTPTTKPQSPTEPSEDSGKLDVDGSIGQKTILRMQEFFGTLKDGIISGQKESLYKYYPSIEKEQIRFCEGGSICIVKLQTWLGVTADGVLGKDTVKAWQKKLGVKTDGVFGTESAKAWQKYLNEHDKAVYPSKTSGQKIAEKATELAYSGFPKEAKYPSGHAKEAYKKALDAVYPSRSSWGKAARLGASCDVFVGTCVRASGVDPDFPRGLKEQLPYLMKSLLFKQIEYSRSKLQPGDIVIYKRKNAGQHIFIVKNSDLHICEANHESTYGITRTTTKSINYKLKTDNKEWIRIYRAK